MKESFAKVFLNTLLTNQVLDGNIEFYLKILRKKIMKRNTSSDILLLRFQNLRNKYIVTKL